MIQLSHIEKSYNSGGERVEILKDFSLSVQSGEFIALMGPSGSGKSTILGLISGLLFPDS
jgi:ABC-type lipoprotein export system ATPase subunit